GRRLRGRLRRRARLAPHPDRGDDGAVPARGHAARPRAGAAPPARRARRRRARLGGGDRAPVDAGEAPDRPHLRRQVRRRRPLARPAQRGDGAVRARHRLPVPLPLARALPLRDLARGRTGGAARAVRRAAREPVPADRRAARRLGGDARRRRGLARPPPPVARTPAPRIHRMATTEDRRKLNPTAEWRRQRYGRAPEREDELFSTISGIELEPLYTPDNVAIDYGRDLGFPGEFPFTRGVYPSMYRGRLWTMRQFAGFGTAEETNERFRYLLAQGQTGLSTAFDMPTL